MTTIITKNGNGIPPSLEVGELAIDKSEPALYTNTGSGIEKIGDSKSGGGGTVGIVSNWPDSSTPDWRNPWNASLTLKQNDSSLKDLINITSGSGYLLAIELVKRSTNTQEIRCKITVDGKVVKNMSGSTAGDNIVIIFWPPTTNAPARTTTSFSNGSIPPAFPLRFESRLRVQLALTSGTGGITPVGQYLLT